MFKTSIIIPNKNGEAYLTPLLFRLYFNQEGEIVFVDNESTDGSWKIACKYAHQAKLNKPGKSFAESNNIGAKLASGENLLFLNNDTLPDLGFVKEMEKCISDSSPIVGAKIIFGKNKNEFVSDIKANLVTEQGKIQTVGIKYTSDGMPYEYGRGDNSETHKISVPRASVTGACLMIKKSFFEELGGFDEKFVNGWEDTDLCLRALLKGKKCVYQPSARITHYCSSTKGRFTNEDKNIKYWKSKWIDTKLVFKALDKYKYA